MADGSTFDPTRYLTKVSGRDYLEVKWRLVWMRSQYPGARVVTNLVEHRPGEMAVFVATVTLPPTEVEETDPLTGEIVKRQWSPSATGWGSEGIDDFGDYLEKAETKALGRALAALGFGTQFCWDFEFGADQQRVVDAPTELRGGDRRPSSGGTQGITPRQMKYLHAVAREIGLTNEDIESRSQQAFGVGIVDLSRRQVSQLIEQIQAERGSARLAD